MTIFLFSSKTAVCFENEASSSMGGGAGLLKVSILTDAL
jgi:hypothetical protein